MNKQLYQLHLVAIKESNLYLLDYEKAPSRLYLDNKVGRITGMVKPQHLYITSNEEYGNGDWLTDGKNIWRYILDTTIKQKSGVNRKIVATTNSELNSLKEFNEPDPVYPKKNIKGWGAFPKIPTSFIEAYIKAYNEGKPMTEVWLELYIDRCSGCGDNPQPELCKDKYCSIYARTPHLKLSPNGEVVVVPIEEKMYTRAQVEFLLDEFGKLKFRSGLLGTNGLGMGAKKWFDKTCPSN